MPGRSISLLIIVSCTFACSSSPPTVQTSPGPVSNPGSGPIAISSGPISWKIIPVQQQHRYQAISETVLETIDSTGSNHDTVKSTLNFLLTTAQDGDSIVYSATIESISVTGGPRIGRIDTSKLQLPFSFLGHLKFGQLTIGLQQRVSTVTDCSSELLSATTLVQHAVIAVPQLINKDMVWTDSIQTTVCNGSIPMLSTTAYQYRVVGEGPAGLLLERQDRTTSVGEGPQDQHQVRLQSEGSGTTRVLLDPQTGVLRESAGTRTGFVTVRASGREQRFTQVTREQITLR